MAIDGKWEITINSPMGAQKAKLDFQSSGAALTGTQHAQGASQPVTNGKVDGNNVSWSANITSPMPMTLEFTGSVDGDALKGSVKAGAFGLFPLRRRSGSLIRFLFSRYKRRRNSRRSLFLSRNENADSSGRLAVHRRSVRASGSDQNNAGRYMTMPIHREGWPFIALFAGMNVIAFLIAFWLGLLLLPLTIWCVAFFRDPERTTPDGPGLIICPADGKLLPLAEAAPPAELGMGPAPRTRLSIFMNVFNVHGNRSPVTGTVVGQGLPARQILQRLLRQGQHSQ